MPNSAIEKMLLAPKRLRHSAEVAIEAALRGDAEPLLASQAQAARTLSCSRFTIRRLAADGALHPVNIRGLVRYRVSELRQIAGG